MNPWACALVDHLASAGIPISSEELGWPARRRLLSGDGRVALRIVPAAVVQPRELRSRRGLESAGDARARARKVRQRWERFSVCCTRILLTGIRGRTLETRFPGSSATTTVRRRRPPSGSISSRVSFWAVFPGSLGCGGSSRNAATPRNQLSCSGNRTTPPTAALGPSRYGLKGGAAIPA